MELDDFVLNQIKDLKAKGWKIFEGEGESECGVSYYFFCTDPDGNLTHIRGSLEHVLKELENK